MLLRKLQLRLVLHLVAMELRMLLVLLARCRCSDDFTAFKFKKLLMLITPHQQLLLLVRWMRLVVFHN